MINLKRFNPKRDLEEYTPESFYLNSTGAFYLNEKTEKVWSYISKTSKKEVNVVFQVVYENNSFSVCFSADTYQEETRYNASLVAHGVKKILAELHPSVIVSLEAPIICNLNDYKFNVDSKNMVNYENFVQDACTGKENERPNHFLLFGTEGEQLGRLFERETNAKFLSKENGEHELTIFSDTMAENKKERHMFLEKVAQMGFVVTYLEQNAQINITNMNDLMENGLLEIAQSNKN